MNFLKQNLGLFVLLAIIGFVVWFFGFRASEVAVASAESTYRMPVPKLYFVPGSDDLRLDTVYGTALATVVSRTQLGVGQKKYALVYLPRPSHDDITAELLRQSTEAIVEALDGRIRQTQAVTTGDHTGLEAVFQGRERDSWIYGRVRVFAVGNDVVGPMLMCNESGCADDPDRVRHLEEFAVTEAP